jgi:hypothetical protein
LLFGIIVIMLLFNTHQAQAQAKIERTPLTLELLQTKLHNPILREGSLTVDLRNMTINLRPENAGFRDELSSWDYFEFSLVSVVFGGRGRIGVVFRFGS